MSQRDRRQRIRQISSQINDLSNELDRLLRIEDTDSQRAPAASAPTVDFSLEPRVGDRVEITNTYLGLFGATRGSKGRVAEVLGNRISLRLERNGAIVSRGTRNVRVIERKEDAGRAAQ